MDTPQSSNVSCLGARVWFKSNKAVLCLLVPAQLSYCEQVFTEHRVEVLSTVPKCKKAVMGLAEKNTCVR